MVKIKFDFNNSFKKSPVTFCVHKQQDDAVWDLTASHLPELPKAIPGIGFCKCLVEYENQQFEFVTIYEIEHVIQVLEQKALPTTTKLSREALSTVGPNTHWLSRFPLKSKSYKNRLGLTKILRKAIVEHPENTP